MRELNNLIDAWSRIFDQLTWAEVGTFLLSVVVPVALMLTAYDVFRFWRKRRQTERLRGFEIDTTPKP